MKASERALQPSTQTGLTSTIKEEVITPREGGKNLIAWSAISALAVIGLSAYVYRVLQKRSEQKKA